MDQLTPIKNDLKLYFPDDARDVAGQLDQRCFQQIIVGIKISPDRYSITDEG